MRKPISLCLAVGIVAVAATALVAQTPPEGAPAPGGQAPARGPAGPTNLKVLPKTWSGRQVGALMSTFTESLGVQCDYCHEVDPNAPPPPPGRGPRLDYSLDTKKEKDIAREMIKMVMSINDGTKSIGDATVTEKVTCFTCHRGDKEPAHIYPAEEFARRSGGPCEVAIVPDCDHFYTGRFDAVSELIGGWLKRTL